MPDLSIESKRGMVALRHACSTNGRHDWPAWRPSGIRRLRRECGCGAWQSVACEGEGVSAGERCPACHSLHPEGVTPERSLSFYPPGTPEV